MTELTDEQRKLLEARLGKKRVQPGEAPPRAAVEVIPPHGVEGPVPLSTGQQALLFEYHRRADEPVYNVTHSYRITGGLDLERFGDAVRTVVAAHEPLHISFSADRRVLPIDEAVSIEYVDADEPFDDLAARIATERIDLETGPLLRVVLSPITEDPLSGDQVSEDPAFGVVLALHHVSCDAGSLAALWADLATVYGGDELAERKVSYSDHSQWQRQKTTDDDVEWWLDQLGDSPQTVSLALARSADEPDGYLTHQLSVSTEAVEALGSRPLPLFLSAYGVLLQHLGGVDQPAVSVAMSTRDHPSTESMVGYFLSMLPFTIPVGDHSFTSLIADVEERLAGGMRRRHVGLGEILRHMQASADDVNPHFDIDALTRTMFVVDAEHTPTLANLSIDEKIHSNGSSVAGLTMFVRPHSSGGWEAALEYRGEECSADQAAMILDRFDAALLSLLASPDQPIRNLLLHRAADTERADIDPAAVGDLDGGEITASIWALPELIADIAEAGPIAPAVSCGSRTLSYGDLIRQADFLAHRLRSEGIESGQRVAIVLPRSVDLVVAILGVLRAGASYVPIDPAYPAGRRDLIIDAAQPQVIITGEAFLGDGNPDGLPAGPAKLLSVPSLRSVPETAPPADHGWCPDLDAPAYVIFTSGSTGTPRGVEVTHRNLASSTLARFDVYDSQPERFLLLSSYGFDSSIVGLFWTLAAGGEVVLPTDTQVGDFDEIAGLVESAEITHLLAVPTLYDALLRRAPDRLGGLRVAMIAGEAAPVAIVGRHHAMVPRCQLVNEYGPTEATVWATSFDCVSPPADEPASGGAAGVDSVSIGGPIPGTFVRVADAFGRPLPADLAGELWIGGAGITNGYINDAEATAAKFVTDPISGAPMYRTGDLVRVNEHGELDFLGRVDNQLSIGGVRIEPEEVEAALSAHPKVQASVVLVDSRQRLIALVEPDSAIATAAQRQALETELGELATHQLPVALRPKAVAVVSALPRSGHGKVDRQRSAALVPELQSTTAASVDGSSGTAASEVLGGVLVVWQSVLGDDSLSVDSDFFASGGDSLRALELCEQLEPLAGRRVGMGELIDARTPAKLAAVLGLADGDSAAVELELFETLRHPTPTALVEQRPTLVLLPPGGGNLLAYGPLVRQLDRDQPIVGFRLPGADGRSEPVHSIDEQADRILPELLAAVAPGDGYNLVGWSTGGLLAIELASRLERLGHPVAMAAMVDTIYPGHQRIEKPTILTKYRTLLDEGGVRSIAEEAQERAKIRVRERSKWLRARVAERRGVTDDAMANEQRLFEIAFGAAVSYRPPTYDGSITFFAASATDASRTITPWSDHLATLDVVVVEGRHAEEEAVLDAERVGPIVDHLTKLLASD